MGKNVLMEALRSADKTGELFTPNGTFIAYKTGFPTLDYYLGCKVNVFNSDGQLDNTYNSLGITAGSINTIIGKSHVGKAQPVDTIIPTPDGEKLLGELKPGDYVFNRHGKPVKVLEVFDRGKLEVFRVCFDDGRTTLCNDDHLWSYYTSKNKLITRSLREMMEKPLRTDIGKTRRYNIPVCEAVEYSEKKYEIDPYEIGSFITDNELEISTNSKIILDTDRRIPKEYLYGSIEQRWGLVQGLFDACGCISRLHGVQFTSIYKKLIDDVRTLLFSLGFKTTLHENKKENCYILHVITENKDKEKFFRLSKEKEKAISKKYSIIRYNSDRSGIVSIDDLGYKCEMRCIYVDDPEHLYLTNDYIVTHNTTFAIQLASNIVRPFPNGSVIHCDLEGGSNYTRIAALSKYTPNEMKEGKYVLRQMKCSIEEIKMMISKIYLEKINNPKLYMYDTGKVNEFGDKIEVFEPTCLIIDSVASLTTYVNENTKDGVTTLGEISSQTEQMRLTAEVGRFLKESMGMMKSANIIMFLINHIKDKPPLGPIPSAPELRYLKSNETLPCGKALQYYTNTMIRLTSIGAEKYEMETDGFNGFGVAAQFVKNRGNVDGTSVPLVFDKVHGYDSLRSSVSFAKTNEMLGGNRNGYYFINNKEQKFTQKEIHQCFADNRELYKIMYNHILPVLDNVLSSVSPESNQVIDEEMDY